MYILYTHNLCVYIYTYESYPSVPWKSLGGTPAPYRHWENRAQEKNEDSGLAVQVVITLILVRPKAKCN